MWTKVGSATDEPEYKEAGLLAYLLLFLMTARVQRRLERLLSRPQVVLASATRAAQVRGRLLPVPQRTGALAKGRRPATSGWGRRQALTMWCSHKQPESATLRAGDDRGQPNSARSKWRPALAIPVR